MEKFVYLTALSIATVIFSCNNYSPNAPLNCPQKGCDYIHEIALDSVMTGNTAAKIVDFSGFREFAVSARFEGAAGASFDFEISFDRKTIIRENIVLNNAGWLNFAKTYPVYAPNVGLVVYHAPAGTKAYVSFYAGK